MQSFFFSNNLRRGSRPSLSSANNLNLKGKGQDSICLQRLRENILGPNQKKPDNFICKPTKTFLHALLLCLGIYGTSINADILGDENNTTAEESHAGNYTNFLQDIAPSSPHEPAFANDNSRIFFSLAAERSGSIRKKPFATETHLKQQTKKQIIVNKGIFYPLNIGLMASFSSADEKPIYQLSPYLQWTIFEKFALPAFAVRLQYEKLFGLEASELEILTSGLQSSWGFKNLTLFAGVSFHHKFYTIYTNDSQINISGKFFSVSKNWGLHIQLIPSFISLTGEVQHSKMRKQIAAKLSIEI